MIDILIEIVRYYGMEMNVDKTKVIRISSQPIPNTYYDRSKTTGKSEIFQLFV
jgi:hypothetical protein